MGKTGGGTLQPHLSSHGKMTENAPMAAHPLYPNYDPDFCAKVITIAAIACSVILGASMMVLATIDPDPALCRGWRFHDPGETSAWSTIAIFAGAPTAWVCYLAMRPKWFEQKVVASLERQDFVGDFPSFLFPLNFLIVVVMFGWACFCALPLLQALHECTRLLRL